MPPRSTRNKSLLAILSDLFERKTIKAFAYRVKALEELDRDLQDAVRPHLAADDPIQMILFAPAQSVLGERPQRGWRPGFLLPWEITPERTLVLTSRQLVIASTPRRAGQNREAHLVGERASPAPDSNGVPPVVVSIPLSDILYLETGSILLSSWIEVAWACNSHLECTRIHYNTVCRNLFEELAASIRQYITRDEKSPPALNKSAGQGLDLLDTMPFKFKNLIPLRLLLPGEQVKAAVFRPSIWEKKGLFFNRHVAPKMAFVRTGRYLILAQEDLTPDENTYGLIAQFCPLHLLRCAELQETPAGLELVLTLSLHGIDFQLRRIFPPEAKLGLQAALNI